MPEDIPPTLTDYQLWSLIEGLDWRNAAEKVPFHRQKVQMLIALPFVTIQQLHAFGRARRSELSEAWQAYEEENPDADLGVGDDSFNDLTSHVVGLGREVFKATVEKPALLLKRAEEHDYQENFFYIFPSSSDVHIAQHSFYTQRAGAYLKGLAELTPVSKEQESDIHVTYMAMHSIAQGKWSSTEEERKQVSKALRRLLIHIDLPHGYRYEHLMQELAEVGDILQGEIPKATLPEPKPPVRENATADVSDRTRLAEKIARAISSRYHLCTDKGIGGEGGYSPTWVDEDDAVAQLVETILPLLPNT